MSGSQSSTENRSSPLFMSDRSIDTDMDDAHPQDSPMIVEPETPHDEDLNVGCPSRKGF